jgi:hypothetical protein
MFDGNIMMSRVVLKFLDLAGLYGRPASVSTKVVWRPGRAITKRRGVVVVEKGTDPFFAFPLFPGTAKVLLQAGLPLGAAHGCSATGLRLRHFPNADREYD